MKVIIEGVDGVGKTTLAKKIAELFNLKYCHDNKPRTYTEYLKELSNGKDCIYDRFFFGQFAGYQSKDERLLTEEELDYLINFCKQTGVVIIVCHDTVENIMKRFKYNKSDKKWMEKTGFKTPEEFIETIQNGFLRTASRGLSYINYLDMSKVIPNE